MKEYSGSRSLHRDRLGQVAWLIHVPIPVDGCVVSQQLQRNRGEHGQQSRNGLRHLDDVIHLADQFWRVTAHDGQDTAVRALTSSMLETIFEYTGSRGASATTGMFSSMRAIGPCFISAAGYPSAWM